MKTTTSGSPEDGFIHVTETPEYTLIRMTMPEGYFETHQSPHGPYISTPGCRKLPEAQAHRALERFNSRDWGDMADPEDRKQNDENHRASHGVVLGVYPDGETCLWVHQSMGSAKMPTILLPQEN